MELTKRNLTGKEYLAAVTDLLQRIRLEDAFAGVYEAGEVQWQWRRDDAPFPERQTFWVDALGQAIACLLLHEEGDEWNIDFIYLPSARQVVKTVILPEVLTLITHPDAASSPKALIVSVRADDPILQQQLIAAGFAPSENGMALFNLVDAPPIKPLPAGFALTSRADEMRKEEPQPHHLIRRNGPHVAEKLAECSLYRPDLDLCIRDAEGAVAAYALFWMDERTQVGVLEPMRTEADFQRLGLARHLIAEGVARLQKLGATSIRVATFMNNEAAAKLYRSCGFADYAQIVEYRKDEG